MSNKHYYFSGAETENAWFCQKNGTAGIYKLYQLLDSIIMFPGKEQEIHTKRQ